MRALQLISALNHERAWLASQAGKKRIGQADRDRVENLAMACLAALAFERECGGRSLRRWFDRKGFAAAFRDRQSAAFTKKWNPRFLQLVDVAIGVLEPLPREIVSGCPLDALESRVSDARRAALAKARAARWAKSRPLQSGTYSESPSLTGENLRLENKGFSDPQTSTFGDSTEAEKSALRRWNERKAAITAQKRKDLIYV